MPRLRERLRSDRRRKVCVLTPWYPSQAAPGAGAFVEEQALAVDGGETDVTVLWVREERLPLRRPGDIAWRRAFRPLENVRRGIRTVEVVVPRDPRFGTLGNLLSWTTGCAAGLRHIGAFGPQRLDIVHAHVSKPAGIAAVSLRPLHRAAVVISEHACPTSEILCPNRLSRALVHWALRGAIRVLPVSDFLRRDLEQQGFRATYEVVPNPIDTRLFRPLPASASNGRRPGPKLLTVGHLIPRKNIGALLEALVHLDRRCDEPATLAIVGEGPERRALETKSQKLGLAHRVRFLGSRSRTEVARLMRTADVLVHPARLESFGCVIAEAMASGIPVAAGRVGALPEIIPRDGGRFFDPEDPENIAATIAAVVEGLATFPRARIAAQVDARFGRTTVGRRLQRVYASILEL